MSSVWGWAPSWEPLQRFPGTPTPMGLALATPVPPLDLLGSPNNGAGEGQWAGCCSSSSLMALAKELEAEWELRAETGIAGNGDLWLLGETWEPGTGTSEEWELPW